MSRLLIDVNDDALAVTVSWIPVGDLLPTALACKRLRDMCTSRASLKHQTIWDKKAQIRVAVRWKTYAATSVNRAKWAIAMGATPQAEWCAKAANQGDLGLLQWLRLVGAPWNGSAYVEAARNGHMHVLNFLLEHHCSFANEDEEWNVQAGLDIALIVSADSGQLAASQWLYLRGASPDEFATASAAGSGCMPLLEWLFAIGATFTKEATFEACEHGELEALQWLHAHGVPWDNSAFTAAAAAGSMQLLQFMHANGAMWSEVTAATAAAWGHLDTLKFLRDTGASLHTSIAPAARSGHLHILHWLFENGVNSIQSRRVVGGRLAWYPQAASVKVLEVLHSHGDPLHGYCVHAACAGDLEMLHWLHEHDAPLHPCAVCMAARAGHLRVLEWLRAHGAPEPGWNDCLWVMSMGYPFMSNDREWLELVGYWDTYNLP